MRPAFHRILLSRPYTIRVSAVYLRDSLPSFVRDTLCC
jgi:hypothetical protein